MLKWSCYNIETYAHITKPMILEGEIILAQNSDKFFLSPDYQKVLEVYTNNGNYQELEKLNIVLSKGLLYEQSILLKKEGGMVCE